MGMEIAKPTSDDKAYFESLVPEHADVIIKPMFGNLAAFVNGNMFMGLFGADVGLRLSEEDRAALESEGGGAFGPAGRPMREYVSLPTAWRDAPANSDEWIQKALTHTAAMPPKKKK